MCLKDEEYQIYSLTDMDNFYPLEVVDCGSERQIKSC